MDFSNNISSNDKDLIQQFHYKGTNLLFEFRNHLSAITAFSELLYDHAQTYPTYNSYSRVIINSSNHLLELVENIFKNPFLQSKHLEVLKLDCYLHDFFYEIYKNFKKYNYYLKKKDISFKYSISENLKSIKLRFATHELNIILFELLSNAFKFTHNGEIIFGVEGNKNSLKFYVKDTGIGIPKSVLNNVFQNTPITSDVNNSDLCSKVSGLTTIKKMTDRIDGKLEVISSINKGSEFYLYLPINIDLNQALKHLNYETICIASPDTKFNLLVIGDIDTYNILNIICLGSNFTTIFAEDEVKAIEEFKKGRQFDMILIDLTSNLKSQINLFSECKGNNKEAQIIALRSKTTAQLISSDLQNIYTKIILKPVPYLKISQLIKSLINK